MTFHRLCLIFLAIVFLQENLWAQQCCGTIEYLGDSGCGLQSCQNCSPAQSFMRAPCCEEDMTDCPCCNTTARPAIQQSDCKVVTKHPEYGLIGGAFDRVRITPPLVRRFDGRYSAILAGFNVLTERTCGDPSSYVLVVGIVKTSATNLRSEIELQAEPLTAATQVIRVQQKTINNLEETDVLKVFVRLVHSKSRELVDTQDSEEWAIKDLLSTTPEARRETRIRPKRLVWLPY